MPLAVAIGAGGSTSQIAWTHGNHLGTPLLTTDASGNAIAPYGYALIGFPGQWRLAQAIAGAEFYYNRYRDYDPSLGGYIQADPIGLAGDVNPYAYALGNPLRYTDPNGLETSGPNGTSSVSGTKYRVRIDKPTSGRGKVHAQIYDPKGSQVGAINDDGTPSHKLGLQKVPNKAKKKIIPYLLSKGFKLCKPLIIGTTIWNVYNEGPAEAASTAIDDFLWPLSIVWEE